MAGIDTKTLAVAQQYARGIDGFCGGAGERGSHIARADEAQIVGHGVPSFYMPSA